MLVLYIFFIWSRHWERQANPVQGKQRTDRTNHNPTWSVGETERHAGSFHNSSNSDQMCIMEKNPEKFLNTRKRVEDFSDTELIMHSQKICEQVSLIELGTIRRTHSVNKYFNNPVIDDNGCISVSCNFSKGAINSLGLLQHY
ncbi:hypothetical protein CEXT_495901 [Caerostris extrusa]|uniref:Uncharacterized protein n=1 Tax=Caerostris extrusa TaxID=172846 RepID=A0AAV4MR72_CAEEX|nr:hypothetical protein CEXT_495901 [Caerostris extrusa]